MFFDSLADADASAGTDFFAHEMLADSLPSNFQLKIFQTMKNASKKCKQVLATLFLLLGLLVTGFSAPPVITDCSCPSPNVTITSQATNAITFSWGAVSGAIGYQAWYVRSGDNFTSQQMTINGTSVSFSNLPNGKYEFYFATDCGGEVSQIIIMDDLIMG